MEKRRESLNGEIDSIRKNWEVEKEEYLYNLKREQQRARNKFEDEKMKLEKELQLKREAFEKEFQEREKPIAEKENLFKELQAKVDSFPKELESAIAKTIEETTKKIKSEAESEISLLKKGFEGERKVSNTQIAILEKDVKDQSGQIKALTQKLENAYQKVQDIAVKSIEGASNLQSFTELKAILGEGKKQTQSEK
jgi:hypothetical protein